MHKIFQLIILCFSLVFGSHSWGIQSSIYHYDSLNGNVISEGFSSKSESFIYEAAGFKVKPTPTRRDPNHVTIELPKPVTKEVADKFNNTFGR